MILHNNNFSVLPFYDKASERDSQRWWVGGKVYPLYMCGRRLIPFQIVREYTGEFPIEEFKIYNSEGTMLNLTSQAQSVCRYKPFLALGYEVLACIGANNFFNLPNGRYYIYIDDGQQAYYSDWFTYVVDAEPYLKLQWWDDSDFIMDSGVIVYENPSFKNELYLPATIAKPSYEYEEEGESRDGFFFPTKQISTKRYRFTFLAPEYLLDVLRFVRLSEHIIVKKGDAEYNVDNILITPEWEAQGDLAAVTCEFDTDTVAKKIGMAYVRGA